MLATLFRHFPHLRRVHGLPQIVDTALLAHTLLLRPTRIPPREAVERALLSWPGVSTKIHRFGGVEFIVNGREIGHIHGHGLLDIPFTRDLRDDAVTSGLARPHHIFPLSAWVSFDLHTNGDVPNALILLRRNYERRQAMDTEAPTPPHVL